MFIYKYMSGVVEYITGLELTQGCGDDYDPHKYRIIENPCSYSQTMMHLLKGSIGAGVLAMPGATGRVGIITSIIAVILIGAFATYCIHLLIAGQYELCKRQCKGYMTYPRSIYVALKGGPNCMRCTASFAYYFVDSVLVLWQLGICNIYVVFVAESIQQICDFYGALFPLREHILFLLIPLVLVGLVRDLKLLTPFSSISNALMLLGLVLVFFYLIEDDLSYDYEKMRLKNVSEIPIFFGTALFAIEAVGVILALEYNMEKPKEFVGLFGLFNVGMTVIVSLYTLVGVFGYLKYGDDIQSVITLNLPAEEKKAQAAKVLIAAGIFLTFPLQNYVAYSILWHKLKKTSIVKKKEWIVDYLLRIVLVILPWLWAIAVPNLGALISFFGAFCLTFLAVIFPGILDLCIWHPDKYGSCKYRLVRDVLIIITGFFCLISGCYTTISIELV